MKKFTKHIRSYSSGTDFLNLAHVFQFSLVHLWKDGILLLEEILSWMEVAGRIPGHQKGERTAETSLGIHQKFCIKKGSQCCRLSLKITGLVKLVMSQVELAARRQVGLHSSTELMNNGAARDFFRLTNPAPAAH